MRRPNQQSQQVRIGSICELINGRAFKPTDWTPDGLPIVRIQNLNNPEATFNRFNGEVRGRFLIETGALLFAWSGTPGTSFGAHIWNGGPAILNQHIFNVLLDEARVDKQYLRFAMNQKLDELIDKAHGGVGLQHVTKVVDENTTILLPSLKEQRRIADLLNRAEGIVRLRRDAQKKAADIVPTLFLDMFGDPGTNFRGWPTAALGDVLTSVDSGQSPRCHDRPRKPHEWGVLRLGGVTLCEYDEGEHKTLPAELQPDTSIEVRQGDLLLSRKNTRELVGATAYVWNTSGRILLPDLVFRLNIADQNRLHPIYLWRLLITPAKRDSLRRLASGSAGSMPNISKERLRTLRIELPPHALQLRFAEFVAQVRSIQLQQEGSLDKARLGLDALLGSVFSPGGTAAASQHDAVAAA